MGKFDFRPARVHQTATQLLRTERIKARPSWYDVAADIPPSQILVRTQPVQHSETRKGAKKPSKLFKPQKVSYPEDALRRTFFKDHPWELARPRVVLEDSGDDYRRQHWGSIRAPGGHLSGENVVQRQAWLMEQKQLPKEDAYDQARREFYGERMREDIERRVAKEEATHTGAYFGRTMLGIGNEIEDETFEKFRTLAEKNITETEQTRAAVFSGISSLNSSEEPGQVDSATDGTEALMEAESQESQESEATEGQNDQGQARR